MKKTYGFGNNMTLKRNNKNNATIEKVVKMLKILINIIFRKIFNPITTQHQDLVVNQLLVEATIEIF